MPEGGWLLNSGAATAVGKIIISAAKAKGVKTINLVRFRPHVLASMSLPSPWIEYGPGCRRHCGARVPSYECRFQRQTQTK